MKAPRRPNRREKVRADGGQTWDPRETIVTDGKRTCGNPCPVERVLEEGYGGYSDLAVTDGGEVLCLYEAEECRKMALARFGVEWIMAVPGAGLGERRVG